VFIPTIDGELLNTAPIVRMSQEHDGSKVTVRADLVDGKSFELGDPDGGTLEFGLIKMRELVAASARG
jgi:hypothetical protein